MKLLYVYNMSLNQYIAVYVVWQISVCHEIPEVLRHIVMTGELSFIQKDVVTLLYIMHWLLVVSACLCCDTFLFGLFY